ncbi:MAG TPA: TRAM domain-containing protein [Polyangia bacterium]|nr:TRAM domain-containing protein [Polyangia bacterium]
MAPQFLNEVGVEIESLAPGGDAVGRQLDGQGARAADDGRVTFVPLAAPGERVRARIEREKGKVAWAELVAIERPGPDRVPPPCPLFGTCGGCQWQQVTIEAQHAAKRAIVERALGAPVPEVIAAGPPFGYRDRARLTVGPGGVLGFHARRSHDVVDVPACPLFGPELRRALPALRAMARGLAAGVEIDVQAGIEGVHVNVARADPNSAAHARREFDRLEAAGVVGLLLGGRATAGRVDVDIAEPGSPPLRVPADGFAQVGRVANAALVAAVMKAVGPAPGVVLELYAGSGNLTRHLVRAGATSVTACDGDPAALARGAHNVMEARWSLRPPAIDADTVVLDPPRDGADKVHLAAAARASRRIVYVSCDPQTLGRDARGLRAAGFELVDAVALDLMPQTFHVEVVATFDRERTGTG